MKIINICFLPFLFITPYSNAFCFHNAAKQYDFDENLLLAIAIKESSLNQYAINKNSNSVDYGLMQINSSHIYYLKKLKIINDTNDLLNDACLNVQIGAWILRKHLKVCGENWACLGTYNSGFSKNRKKIRNKYSLEIKAIYENLIQLK